MAVGGALGIFFFFSSRRRHTRSCLVSWARRCVQETDTFFCCITSRRQRKNPPRRVFCGQGAELLLHRAGVHAEQRIGRAPAHQPSCEGYDADVAPDRQHAGCGGANQAGAGNDTKDFVDTANICSHGVFSVRLCVPHVPVSYTHLTLPTICSVQISVVAGSLKKKKERRQGAPTKTTKERHHRRTER
eukprot:TRINITY_DN1153_c0_g1_i1.p2 TRINITY_DN1153_c0_g1~~TRINITY_DN1153_c0_g1_i1.p2  ORF type:complete len:188 (-),score=13.37 TRINITY_DN1153_c0_g1_i1:26-589(-)